jgi:5-(hydroxymethyl)furfural/furfural oxidase
MIAGNLRPAEDGGTARARLAVSAFQAFSEGSVRITTRDPAIDPRVDERMLSHDSDLLRMRDGVRRLREIGLHEDVRAIAARVDYGMTGRPIEEPFSAQELDDWMFAECSDAQHASGTCRMGRADDPRSVVDPDCRLIGCSGLRVIDASVMPTVVRANTHLTTVMIAEKMADHLKQSVKSHVIRKP